MIEPLSSLSLATTLNELLHASLDPLPIAKPRLVTDVRSPHEILRLIRDIGVDVFDAGWAVKAADIGVAFDFIFPVPVRRKVRSRLHWFGRRLSRWQ